ncbi:MAG: ATP-binding protein [Propionibacteriaceae bacterium]|jgi:hypothetical protein|nr:ATP-binding protein [Propionibacteriaceae bacterium]
MKPHGAQMGMDWDSRAAFYFDPVGWVLDETMPVNNPNVWIFGSPGRGKSALVKAIIIRMAYFGVRSLIVGDVKDEYEALCRFFGVEPIAIGQGLANRINPLELGPLMVGWESLPTQEQVARCNTVFARWLTLLRGMVGSQKIGRSPVPFGPVEEHAVDYTLKQLTGVADGASMMRPTTITQLWRALDEPSPELIGQLRYSGKQQFIDETRLLRDALGSMVTGALGGLFDQETTIKLDWNAPIVSLSLSRLEGLGEEATGMALLCLNSWARAMREASATGDLRIVVRDECWKQMRLGVDAVKSFDADLRLSRRDGDIQIAIGHKPSDLVSVGDAGSQEAAIAKDLLHLADTKVLLGQDAQVADELEQMLGLGEIARNTVTGWARQERGRALWIVGERMFRVQTILHWLELNLAWTQGALAGAL